MCHGSMCHVALMKKWLFSPWSTTSITRENKFLARYEQPWNIFIFCPIFNYRAVEWIMLVCHGSMCHVLLMKKWTLAMYSATSITRMRPFITRLEQLSNGHIFHVPWFHVPHCSDGKMIIFPVVYDLDNPYGQISTAIWATLKYFYFSPYF